MKIFKRLESPNIVLYFISKQKHFLGCLGLLDADNKVSLKGKNYSNHNFHSILVDYEFRHFIRVATRQKVQATGIIVKLLIS